MGRKNIIGNVTLSHIHKTVISSTAITQAADKLHVSPGTLSTYLSRILYKNPINYNFLKRIPLENAEQEFGAIYQKPFKEIISADEKKVWVYFGTGNIYDGKVDETQLTNTREKNGQIELGELCQTDGQCIRLELIPKNTLQLRKKVWVYLGTSEIYDGKVDETQLINTVENDGHIVQGNLLQEDGQSIRLELIAKSAQKQRKKVWVYLETSRIYEGKVNETQLANAIKKRGCIVQGDLLQEDGEFIRLELIAKGAQKQRKKIRESKSCNGEVGETQLTNKKKKNGYIAQSDLLQTNGQSARLELIAKQAQQRRSGIWVHLGTSTIYSGTVDETQLTNIKEKNGYIVQGDLLQEDGQFIRLEFISKNAFQLRKKIWVYLGTNRIYDGTVDEKQLTNIKEKHGCIVQGDLLQADGQSIQLEFIARQTQRRRTDVWVHLGTSRVYSGIVDEKQLINTREKHGCIVEGDLPQADGQSICLELIAKHTQQARVEVWVHLGTSRIYNGIVDEKQLINTREKHGYIVQGDLLQEDGQFIRLELISRNALQLRKKIWVHLGTGRTYDGIVDEKQLTNIEVNDGQIVQGDLLQADGQTIRLELIKKVKCRQRGLWFHSGGDRVYYDIADYKKLKAYRKQDISCYQHPQQADALVLYFTNDLAGIACINASVVASFINKEIKKAWSTYATVEEFDATEDASSCRNFVVLNKFSALFSLLYEEDLPVWLEKLGGHDNCKDYPQMPEEIRHVFITHSPVSWDSVQNNIPETDSLLNEPEFQVMDFNFSDELALFESELLNNPDEQMDFSSIFTSSEVDTMEFSLEDELFKDASGESSNIWRNFEDYGTFYQSFTLSSVANQNASIGEDPPNERGELLSNKNNSYSPEFFSNSQGQSFDYVVSEKNDEVSNIPYSPAGFFSSGKHHCENRVEDSNSNKKMRMSYLLNGS